LVWSSFRKKGTLLQRGGEHILSAGGGPVLSEKRRTLLTDSFRIWVSLLEKRGILGLKREGAQSYWGNKLSQAVDRRESYRSGGGRSILFPGCFPEKKKARWQRRFDSRRSWGKELLAEEEKKKQQIDKKEQDCKPGFSPVPRKEALRWREGVKPLRIGTLECVGTGVTKRPAC